MADTLALAVLAEAATGHGGTGDAVALLLAERWGDRLFGERPAVGAADDPAMAAFDRIVGQLL